MLFQFHQNSHSYLIHIPPIVGNISQKNIISLCEMVKGSIHVKSLFFMVLAHQFYHKSLQDGAPSVISWLTTPSKYNHKYHTHYCYNIVINQPSQLWGPILQNFKKRWAEAESLPRDSSMPLSSLLLRPAAIFSRGLPTRCYQVQGKNSITNGISDAGYNTVVF